MKKLLLLLCLVTSIFAMTACSQTETKAPFEYDEAEVITSAELYLDDFNANDYSVITEEQYEAFLEENGEELQPQVDMWKSFGVLQPDLGAFVSKTSTTVKNNADTITVEIIAKYEKDNMVLDVAFDKDLTATAKVDIYRTMTQKMQKALLNTIMCMSVVFAVLIFIAFIIGLLKYIPMIIEKMTSKNAPQAKAIVSIENTTTAIAVQEAIELSDDLELVAVITAAIMASMGAEAPSDGLIVRSIRKANREKWLRA